MKRSNVLLIFCVAIMMAISAVAALTPVPYREVQSIVLRAGEMTAGRRSVVPQVVNVGPAYDSALLPSVIQCSNMGWDGHQYTWKCQAQLADGLDFARTEVSCEDWDPPTRDARPDDVMTAGSCGVEYALKGSPRVVTQAPYHMAPPSQSHTYTTTTTTYRHDDNDLAVAIVFTFFVFVIVFLLCGCCSGSTSGSTTVRVTPPSPAPTTTVRVETPVPAPTVHVESEPEETVYVETPTPAPTVRVRARPAARPTVHVTTTPAPAPTVYVSTPAPTPVYVTPAPSTSSYTSGMVDGMILSSLTRPSAPVRTHTETTHVIRESAPSSSSWSGFSSSGSSSSSSGSSGTHTSTSFGGTKRR